MADQAEVLCSHASGAEHYRREDENCQWATSRLTRVYQPRWRTLLRTRRFTLLLVTRPVSSNGGSDG